MPMDQPDVGNAFTEMLCSGDSKLCQPHKANGHKHSWAFLFLRQFFQEPTRENLSGLPSLSFLLQDYADDT